MTDPFSQALNDAGTAFARGDAADVLRILEPFTDKGSPVVSLLTGAAYDRLGEGDLAIARLQQARAAPLTQALATEALGRALLHIGDAAQARGLLHEAWTRTPDNGQLQAELGLAELACGNEATGLTALAAASARAPTNVWAVWNAVDAHLNAGRTETALTLVQNALAAGADADSLALPHGRALFTLDDATGALERFERVVALHPNSASGWALLGQAKERLGQPDALAMFRRAAELDSETPEARIRLATKLHRLGQKAEARALYAQSMPRFDKRRHRRDQRLRVAALILPGYGNTPVRYLLSTPGHLVERVFLLNDYPYDFAALRANYDVVFSAAGDADLMRRELDDPERVANAIGLPVVNPPHLVMRTTREAMAIRMKGLPHAVVPITLRLPAADRGTAAAEALAEQVGGFPLLIRSTGTHGGDDIARVDAADAFHTAVAGLPPGDAYLTQYAEFASPDGLYRKYRMLVVDGEMLPRHKIFGRKWLCHRAQNVKDTPSFRDEEIAFLEDPAADLGPQVMEALREICHRMDLDYYGIDFAVDQQNRLVFFESNATMLTRMLDGEFNLYRRPFIARVRERFARLLEDRAHASA